MIEDMRLRGMGEKYQKAHIRAIRDFAAFLGHSPDTATPEELRGYQLHMADNCSCCSATTPDSQHDSPAEISATEPLAPVNVLAPQGHDLLNVYDAHVSLTQSGQPTTDLRDAFIKAGDVVVSNGAGAIHLVRSETALRSRFWSKNVARRLFGRQHNLRGASLGKDRLRKWVSKPGEMFFLLCGSGYNSVRTICPKNSNSGALLWPLKPSSRCPIHTTRAPQPRIFGPTRS
ncbi:phage integrase N-terminal SAM-like domain-containing protein [Tropicimonas sp. TH_r6]|uniref:phage integrase N-terminal SAM-like domain-containing protein n=1 Tax=Tropicimonas sp. TH_r6 TaxID=3082085 RepID=UPI00398652E6